MLEECFTREPDGWHYEVTWSGNLIYKQVYGRNSTHDNAEILDRAQKAFAGEMRMALRGVSVIR